MAEQNGIFVAKGNRRHELLLALANRHGLIAGATGTGKTVTLRVMAEGLSEIGVPVFMADVKGDLAGMAKAGVENPKFVERAKKLGVESYATAAMPVVFWDLFGEQGHPVRATVSEMGPLLMARLLELNDTQKAVLEVAFKFADDNGLLLDELRDLRDLLAFMLERAKEIQQTYGNIAPSTVGAIQRGLTALGAQGGDDFFKMPAFEIENDLLKLDGRGRGLIHVLAADKLMLKPRLYATFLLWLLSELFERLPEVGDLDKPKLVFFFDEAHLLFSDSPPALLQKIEQLVRLIRSKGVGVYFVTQNPLDVPDTVLGQLGNRVQHALRAFTPKDQKAVKAAAQTFRANPMLDTSTAITELAVGEALVSFLDAKGTPDIVDRALVIPPRSLLGPITPADRASIVKTSPFAGKYDQAEERESAAEQLAAAKQQAEEAAKPQGGLLDALGGIFGGGGSGEAKPSAGRTPRQPQNLAVKVGKQVAGNLAAQVGRDVGAKLIGAMIGGAVGKQIGRTVGGTIVRGVLGSILRGR
ncbi:MAG: DUF853 family protein [Alphaproteobacteria bacterium]|nr:DUF853 family protein [Alphaproteobacteria bacterium]